MAMTSDRWRVITPSQFPWEQDALDFIRGLLPDHDPYRAWSNFEFIATDGSINEVDLLLVTPAGFFIIEIKSRPGKLNGDNSTWKWTDSQGRITTQDNPLLLANRKAKKFVSLLKQQNALRNKNCPFLDEVVFCSADDVALHLTGPARNRVFTRETAAKTILQRDCPGLRPDNAPIDRPTAKAIGQAIEQMGIRPSQNARKVGDYILEDLLFQCPKDMYQEWSATHVSMKGVKRRIRIYNVSSRESDVSKETIRHAAEREYRLLEQLDHDGILRAEQFTLHELGPALIFRYDPAAKRLDHYLAEKGDKLSLDIRLSLVRQIAEALKFAHSKRIIHRALSPQSVLVYDADTARPRIKIFNWQLGRQFIAATNSSSWRNTYTLHPEQLVEDASLLYMAPECVSDPSSAEPYVDVFSLGAIAYHVFSGMPPATSAKELTQKLAAQHYLDLSAVADAFGGALRELVQFSTFANVQDRFESVDNFLAELDKVEDEYTRPEDDFTDHPLDARGGETIEGGFKVKRRMGVGGSATAFLVERAGREMVLKLANKTEYNERLEAEFKTLKKLRHPLIVEPYELMEANGLRGFTMQCAGEETLSQRLLKDGRLQPEFLQRFGEDLLEILHQLEEHGIYHRDIKPDNIGVGYPTSKSKLRLILFDFSLSSTPLDNVRAGTIRYQDPFLQAPVSRNYDLYAERFSAALTLFEMAVGSGAFPTWGDGKSDPAMLACEATIPSESFDPSLRSGLSAFFAKAFRRDYRKRFDNAEEMLREWRQVFESIGQTETTTLHDEPFDQAAAIASAMLDTKIITLGLSTRALTAMDRLNVLTVKQFLAVPIMTFRQMRGVGSKTRTEIRDLAHSLHRKFPDEQVDERVVDSQAKPQAEEPAAEVPVTLTENLSVDALFRDVCSTGGKGESSSKSILLAFLGVTDGQERLWENQNHFAQHFRVTRARIGQVIVKAREQWRRMPSVTGVRDLIAKVIEEYGGVMSVDDVAAALLAGRGSVAEDSQRMRRSLAVLRATVEAERGNQDLRFTDYRHNGHVVLATSPEIADYAQRLGPVADELAAENPLLSAARAIERLRSVSLPEGASGIRNNADLLRLAANLSAHAAVSGKGEIYPKGMEALRTLRLIAGVLSGNSLLSILDIKERMKGRYPESGELPGHPELDRLLVDAGLDVTWDATAKNGEGAYRFRRLEQFTLSSGSYGSGVTFTGGTPSADEDDADVRLFEQRLNKANAEGAFLALSVAPRFYARAERKLRERFGLEARNLDGLLIPKLKEMADSKRISWSLVLEADRAERDSRDWGNLKKLFSLCVPAVEEELSASGKTVLVTALGLLARYDQMSLLDRLRDKAGVTGSPLHGLWVLVPESGGTPLPTVDGKPVPILSGGQHARIPTRWLKEANNA